MSRAPAPTHHPTITSIRITRTVARFPARVWAYPPGSERRVPVSGLPARLEAGDHDWGIDVPLWLPIRGNGLGRVWVVTWCKGWGLVWVLTGCLVDC